MAMQSTIDGCLKAMRLISIYSDRTTFGSHVKVHSSHIENNRQKHMLAARRFGQLGWPSSDACAVRTYCTRTRRKPTQLTKTLRDQCVLLLIILYTLPTILYIHCTCAKRRPINMCFCLLFSIYVLMTTKTEL